MKKAKEHFNKIAHKIKSTFSKINLSKIQNIKTPELKLKLNLKAIVAVFAFIMLALVVKLATRQLVVATVNGRPIFRTEIIKELERRNGQQVVEGIINQELVRQEARIRGAGVTVDEINTEISKLEEGMKAQGTTLETVLTEQKMTKNELITLLSTNILLEKMIAGKTTVTEEEITKYIADNKDLMPKDTDQNVLKEQVRTMLVQQKTSEETEKLLTELRTKAKVLFNIQY